MPDSENIVLLSAEELVTRQAEKDKFAVAQMMGTINLLMNQIEMARGDRRDEMGRLLGILRTQLTLVRGFVNTDIWLIEIKRENPFEEIKE